MGDDGQEAEVGVGRPGVVWVWFDVRIVDDGEVDEEGFRRSVVFRGSGGVVGGGCVSFAAVTAVSRNFFKEIRVEYCCGFVFYCGA